MLQAVLWKSWLVRLASDWLALEYRRQICDIVLLSSLWNLAPWVISTTILIKSEILWFALIPYIETQKYLFCLKVNIKFHLEYILLTYLKG